MSARQVAEHWYRQIYLPTADEMKQELVGRRASEQFLDRTVGDL